MTNYHIKDLGYQTTRKYMLVKPAYKKSKSKIVSREVGFNLLLENVFGKKAAKSIKNTGKRIGYIASKYGCFDKVYEAVANYDKFSRKQTATGFAIASCLGAILANKNLEQLIRK